MKRKIFFLSIIYFFITLFFLIFNNKSQFIGKNVDNLFLKFVRNEYHQISSYLNKKYDNQNNEQIDKTRKKLKINFVDYRNTGYQTPQINKIIKMLSENYDIEIDENNPSYIFYNVFRCEHFYDEKYNKSIKIAYYTENNIPDLNIADYAIADPHINYLDRYLKYSYIFGLHYKFRIKKFQAIRQRTIRSSIKKKKFCAAVISNHRKYSVFRLKFIEILNKYKKIDMGGHYNNNVGPIKNKIHKYLFFSILINLTKI